MVCKKCLVSVIRLRDEVDGLQRENKILKEKLDKCETDLEDIKLELKEQGDLDDM